MPLVCGRSSRCWLALGGRPIEDRNALPEGRPFFAFGLVLLLVLTRARELRAEECELLSTWVIDEESASRAVSDLFSAPWLLGSTFFDERHHVWRRLGERLLTAPSIPGLELMLVGVREWSL